MSTSQTPVPPPSPAPFPPAHAVQPAPPGPPAPPAPEAGEPARWSSAQKLAFRLLFVIGGGIVLLSVFGNVGLGAIWYYGGVWWTLAQIGSFITRGEGVELFQSGSGDALWSWCWHLGWIVVGLVIVAVWTLLDGKRPNYRSLAGLLEVFARYGLALSMVFYGLAKVIPSQMGYMSLPSHQLQLVGDTSMFHVLWGFMGASIPYSVATGLVELIAGLLLLFRRTKVLGLLFALVATTQVFMMNLFYDVPVKIVSGELFVIAVALTVPYLPNLLRVGLNRGGMEPVPPLPTPGPRWLAITGLVVKYAATCIMILFGVAQGALMTYINHTPLAARRRVARDLVHGRRRPRAAHADPSGSVGERRHHVARLEPGRIRGDQQGIRQCGDTDAHRVDHRVAARAQGRRRTRTAQEEERRAAHRDRSARRRPAAPLGDARRQTHRRRVRAPVHGAGSFPLPAVPTRRPRRGRHAHRRFLT
ncbi:hypothetical protein [Tsukamurella sp. PLM1]|uniref:hypothetical protein n=1 Tax=Tsukamurella sp. PLM1 TaxID=2929795 RepID=UPI0020C142E9|nr:hypothetical protein [Tsukamurella sp. PLM1]